MTTPLERARAFATEARELYLRYFASERCVGVHPNIGEGVWLTEEDAQRLRKLVTQIDKLLRVRPGSPR